MINELSNTDLLKYALDNGIINLSNIQEQVDMKQRREYLEKHPYDIWQGNDNRYYVYLPDKDNNRILKSRKSKKEIEDCIIKYWKQEMENPTVFDIYNEWINGKLEREEITITTKNRYDRQYQEAMSDFGKKRIKSIDEYDIECFVLKAIHDHNMTAKGFSNLRTIIFGIFRLAKKKKLVSYSIKSVISDIEISRKLFRKNRKKDYELIFMDKELNDIFNYFSNKSMDLKDLGVALLFFVGLRPGELSALKWVDVQENILKIHRTEIRYQNENGEYVYEVRDYPKTEAGIRNVVMPSKCMDIIDRIRLLNPDGEYVFETAGTRIRTYFFDDRIRLVCRTVGINERSLNKIRKTYASILIDNNVDESLIISQMGHTDIQTTKDYYYKNRKSIKQKEEIINSVFD